MVATTAKKRLKTNTAAQFRALIEPKQAGMPSALFAGHVLAAAMEHAHANGGVGMPPGRGRSARN